jgi:hypothetical protein
VLEPADAHACEHSTGSRATPNPTTPGCAAGAHATRPQPSSHLVHWRVRVHAGALAQCLDLHREVARVLSDKAHEEVFGEGEGAVGGGQVRAVEGGGVCWVVCGRWWWWWGGGYA